MTRLMKSHYRNGPQYRFGEDVSFAEVKQTFGLRAVSVGKWVTKEEQQQAANLIYDAFADLTQILNVPPSVIGLRETLTLEFGQGGQLGVQAHYDASKRALALAKNAGAGALAHEWWHAFDHYIANKMFHLPPKKGQFASALWLVDSPVHEHPLNALLCDLFKLLFVSTDGQQPSAYFYRAKALDTQFNQHYFSRPQELSARAFEHFIQGQDIKNHFLVSGTKMSELTKNGGFPTKEEAAAIAEVITQYFHLLGSALSQSSANE